MLIVQTDPAPKLFPQLSVSVKLLQVVTSRTPIVVGTVWEQDRFARSASDSHPQGLLYKRGRLLLTTTQRAALMLSISWVLSQISLPMQLWPFPLKVRARGNKVPRRLTA